MKKYVLSFVLLLLSFNVLALEEKQCRELRKKYYHGLSSQFPKACGNRPDVAWLQQWTQACSKAADKIQRENKNLKRHASWNSTGSWTAESTCEALERGDRF